MIGYLNRTFSSLHEKNHGFSRGFCENFPNSKFGVLFTWARRARLREVPTLDAGSRWAASRARTWRNCFANAPCCGRSWPGHAAGNVSSARVGRLPCNARAQTMTLISGSNQERRTMEIRDERQPRITQIAQIKTFPIGTFREIGGQNIDKRSFFSMDSTNKSH